MNLHLLRTNFSDLSTIGELSIDGHFFCFVLEDRERGLRVGMTPSELITRKVFGQTAIPTGRYEVILSFSERFQRQLPLLINVPAFEGIRIHNGNFARDTEGCLLVGATKLPDMVGESKVTLAKLMPLLTKASKKEKIFY
jgi:hypothetical protein